MLTHPLFLIGLIAVGIPIAVHLLQLRRYKQIYFSNVAMLEAMENENRKQKNLRRRLILAARIVAIVALVLAFCQPVIRHKNSSMQPGSTVVSVYIDNSYSMDCGGMDGSLMESARQKAREIANAYKPDDQFQLLTNDASGDQFRWLNRDDFLSAVNEIQTCPKTLSLSTIAKRQNEFVRTATATNHHVYVISDFQRSTADVANYPADSNILTTFIPLEGSTVANVDIDSLAFNSPAYFPGATIEVEVFVHNHANKPVEQMPLRLYVGDHQRALTSVDIAAQGNASAKMLFTIEGDGMLQGYVETTDYPITFDDRMFFSLPVIRQLPVLVVNGTADNPYLGHLFQNDSLISYRQTTAGQIDFTHLSQNGLVILNELHNIPTGLSHSLQEYVQQGGSLLVIPAEGAEPSSYNQLLATMQAPQLGRWSSTKSRARSIQYDAALYQGVFQGVSDNIEMPSVQGHYCLSTSSATVSHDIIQLLDGSDYLTVTPYGEGHLYLFATPLREQYTDFVHQALFVPTLYNMALFSHPILPPYSTLGSTQPIPLSDTYDLDKLPHLQSTDGKTDIIPDIRRMGSRCYLTPHNEVSAAGNYILVDLRAPEKVLQSISFNYSRQESQLDFYNRNDLKRLIKESELGNCSVVSSAQKSMTDYIQQHHQGTPLWRWCLIVVLIALLAETFFIKYKF